MLINPGGSVKWPKRRNAHSSVLINNISTGPQLLVVGGLYSTSDCWLFDITKRIWKELVSVLVHYNLRIMTLHVQNYYAV